jgi:hypothetical protein
MQGGFRGTVGTANVVSKMRTFLSPLAKDKFLTTNRTTVDLPFLGI